MYAPVGSKEVAYIGVPRGTFLLKGSLIGRSFEVISGVSKNLTKLVGNANGTLPSAWLTMPKYFGVVNLSLEAPVNPSLLTSSGTATGDPVSSGSLYFNNVSFSSISDTPDRKDLMFLLAGPDVQIYNSSFTAGFNQVFDILFGDGAIISGNSFTLNNFTGLGIQDSQNVIFEKNVISSQNVPGQGLDDHSGGAGLSIGRGNSQYGQSALSRDVYVGYNTFQNMGSGDQQVITNDGNGGAYIGPVASSTPNSVTLAYDPNWQWMGTTNPGASVLTIAFGTGVGQYSFLRSYSGRTINLATPLSVLPDESSIVVITQYEQNMTIAHNTVTNTLGDAIVLADSFESVIEDNVLTNAGGGILLSAVGPYGSPAAFGPVVNTDVLRNTIAVGEGNFIFQDFGNYLWGIGISDFPGCSLSGLMIRDNTVPAINTMYATDGVNGNSANLVEQNQAIWTPSFPTVGILVQDNSPP